MFGGGFAGALSKNPVIVFFGAVVGALAGHWTASELHEVTAEYTAHWNFHTGWQFRKIPQQQDTVQGQPELSPA
jgi:hypothetical protein